MKSLNRKSKDNENSRDKSTDLPDSYGCGYQDGEEFYRECSVDLDENSQPRNNLFRSLQQLFRKPEGE